MVVSILISVLVAEIVVRHFDGLPLFDVPLPEAAGAPLKPEQVDAIPRAAGVMREWFFSDPSALPNRAKVPEEWVRLRQRIERTQPADATFMVPDMFKAWNSAYAGDPCRHWLLKHAPGQLYLYDPPDGKPSPPYRYLPNATTPLGLVTNQFGWRGRLIEVARSEKTVRIVFIGASTTVAGHHFPFSYPEFVGHWLNQWAAARHPGIRFEVANAAREGTASPDIAAEVRTEILPLRPDLVVYYEGANQFRPESIVEKMPQAMAASPARLPSINMAPPWLRAASRNLGLARRLQAAIGFVGSDIDGREWPKPDYRVAWPAGLDELDPDLAYPLLPVMLNAIERDLDRIRADLATVGGELALSSFVWLVKDGMVLDPIRHRYILEYLNIRNFPFRYRDLERLAAFQNRVFAKYAAVHGLAFIDVAKYTPFDPDLFSDAIHTTYAGERIRAWVVFQQLIPAIEKRLADGSWPRPQPEAAAPPPAPTFTPRLITFDCKSPAH